MNKRGDGNSADDKNNGAFREPAAVADAGPGSSDVMFRVVDLWKSYRTPAGVLKILEGVDFEVRRDRLQL